MLMNAVGCQLLYTVDIPTSSSLRPWGTRKFEGVHRKLLRKDKEKRRVVWRKGSRTLQRWMGPNQILKSTDRLLQTNCKVTLVRLCYELMLQPTRRKREGKLKTRSWWTTGKQGTGTEWQKEHHPDASRAGSPKGGSCEVKQNDSDNKKGNGQQHAQPFYVHHAQRKNRLQLLRDILCEQRLGRATYFITIFAGGEGTKEKGGGGRK